jgi:methylmalonyl-CoA mutase cobalamin-binding domain/chain
MVSSSITAASSGTAGERPDRGDSTALAKSSREAPRIVLAKVGLDGHDRGIRVVARGLRDAGFHVIYSGLWQRPEAVAQAVCDEDADWLGLSLLSGAHLTVVPRVGAALREWGRGDVPLVVGGIIPEADIPLLREHGVAAVFGPGSSIDMIAETLVRERPLLPPDLTRPDETISAAIRERNDASRRLTAIVRGENPPVPAAASQRSRCVAITGSAGAGKSSLISRLLHQRPPGQRVAVLACDPKSPLTGGALLGDRIRMAELLPDPDLFIRSLAVPSGSQGIAADLAGMLDVLGGAGFGLTLLETVGIGQGDVAVRQVADQVVVVLQPETGDTIQWQKAGLLEVADVVVVQKGDLPGSDLLAAEIHETLNLPGTREVPVVRVSAARNGGLGELTRMVYG